MIQYIAVASHRGAWIEIIQYLMSIAQETRVASHRGAWIEIDREYLLDFQKLVASHRGAWIEIVFPSLFDKLSDSRVPQGRVD